MISQANERFMDPKSQDSIKRRHQQLQQVQDWCMDQISHLSLHHSIDDATALTAEHLELLRTISPAETLWINQNSTVDTPPSTLNEYL